MAERPDVPSSDRLEWRVWPFRERPVAGALAFLAVILASVFCAAIGGHVIFGLVAMLVLFGSLNPFFSPTTFRMDAEKVEALRWPVHKVRAWEDIRSCFVDRRGITLSPFVGRAWLEPYRGLRLLFLGDREPVLSFVRAHVPEDTRIVGLAEAARAERTGGPDGIAPAAVDDPSGRDESGPGRAEGAERTDG